jgi:hypothetical protein
MKKKNRELMVTVWILAGLLYNRSGPAIFL